MMGESYPGTTSRSGDGKSEPVLEAVDGPRKAAGDDVAAGPVVVRPVLASVPAIAMGEISPNAKTPGNRGPVFLEAFEPANDIGQNSPVMIANPVRQIAPLLVDLLTAIHRIHEPGKGSEGLDLSRPGLKLLPAVGPVEPPVVAGHHQIPGVAYKGEAETRVPRLPPDHLLNIPRFRVLVGPLRSCERGFPAEPNPKGKPLDRRRVVPRGLKGGTDAIPGGLRNMHMETPGVIPHI